MSSITVRVVAFVFVSLVIVLSVCALLLGHFDGISVTGKIAICSLAATAAAVTASALSVRYFVSEPLAALTLNIKKAAVDSFLLRASKANHPKEIAELADAFNVALSEITNMQVAAIETDRQVKQLESDLALKAELEKQNREIEKANEKLQQRVREMSMLLDVTRQLGSTLELSEILRSITEIVGVAMGADQFTIMLLEGEDRLKVAGCYGISASELSDFTLRMGEGASGIAAQTREPVYIPDVRSDARYVRGPFDPEVDSSLLCIPMVCRDKFVGILNFTRLKTDAFTDDDIVLLQLMGAQAALAVLNAQLFSETREKES